EGGAIIDLDKGTLLPDSTKRGVFEIASRSDGDDGGVIDVRISFPQDGVPVDRPPSSHVPLPSDQSNLEPSVALAKCALRMYLGGSMSPLPLKENVELTVYDRLVPGARPSKSSREVD